MIKLKQLLKEDTITPVMIKILNMMSKMDLDPNDVSDNMSILQNKFAINDITTASNIVIIYKNYYDELGADKNFKTLSNVEVGYDIDTYDDKIIALHQHLDGLHPDLIVEKPYGDYEDVINGNEYWVLTENEVDMEFENRVNEDIDMQLEDSDSLGWLESYVELDDNYVQSFAYDEAEYRIHDMSDDEIIEEVGLEDEVTRLEEELELKIERLSELDDLIYDLQSERDIEQYELDNINEEITDLTTEMELSTNQDEINNLKDDIQELNIQKYDITKKVENYDQRIEELQNEFDEIEVIVDEGIDSAKSDLAENHRDDLLETMVQSIVDDIEYEGIDYFVTHLGYPIKSAIDNFGFLDRERIISDMESDRGSIMNGYDGQEHEEQVNGVTYYIYQTS